MTLAYPPVAVLCLLPYAQRLRRLCKGVLSREPCACHKVLYVSCSLQLCAHSPDWIRSCEACVRIRLSADEADLRHSPLQLLWHHMYNCRSYLLLSNTLGSLALKSRQEVQSTDCCLLTGLYNRYHFYRPMLSMQCFGLEGLKPPLHVKGVMVVQNLNTLHLVCLVHKTH